MFENTVKIQLLCIIYILLTATCSRMNSLVNQANRFFHGFLSDSVEKSLYLNFVWRFLRSIWRTRKIITVL